MCTYTAAEITQTAEQIAFGDSRRSEHAVVAFDHIVQAQNLLAIADAHFQARRLTCSSSGTTVPAYHRRDI